MDHGPENAYSPGMATLLKKRLATIRIATVLQSMSRRRNQIRVGVETVAMSLLGLTLAVVNYVL